MAADPTARAGRAAGPTARSLRFALLGEVLLVGVVVAAASLPLVTALPAVAAGAWHLRRHLSGEPDALRDLLGTMLRAVRDLWAVGVALPVVLLVLAYDVWLTTVVDLPGGAVVGAVSAAAGVGLLVVVLRAAGTWSPGQRSRAAVRSAARRAARDLTGSSLLVAALATCAVLVWMLLPLLALVGGLLALAALAVEHRWAARGPSTDPSTEGPDDRARD